MINELYSRLGEDLLRQLVAAFYRRMKTDDLIGPMYPEDDWEGSEERLADFLIYRFGGPDTYLQKRGHPRLRARHLPFRIGLKERDRWLEIMGHAMKEVEIPPVEALVIGEFFSQIAEMMRNTPETSDS